jgi:hypothetical protein
MATEDQSFASFQQQVWDARPLRKFLAGRERVNDCIAVVVQEWPDEQFAVSDASDRQAEGVVVRELMQNVKRHLHLAYGEREFGFIWTIILQALIWELVKLILQWWRERKENRMALLRWQKHWRKGEGV